MPKTAAGQTHYREGTATGRVWNGGGDSLVTGHTGVEGNERADEGAKEATERPGTQRCPEQFAWLAYVVHTIKERKWSQGEHWFRTENNRHPSF